MCKSCSCPSWLRPHAQRMRTGSGWHSASPSCCRPGTTPEVPVRCGAGGGGTKYRTSPRKVFGGKSVIHRTIELSGALKCTQRTFSRQVPAQPGLLHETEHRRWDAPCADGECVKKLGRSYIVMTASMSNLPKTCAWCRQCSPDGHCTGRTRSLFIQHRDMTAFTHGVMQHDPIGVGTWVSRRARIGDEGITKWGR